MGNRKKTPSPSTPRTTGGKSQHEQSRGASQSSQRQAISHSPYDHLFRLGLMLLLIVGGTAGALLTYRYWPSDIPDDVTLATNSSPPPAPFRRMKFDRAILQWEPMPESEEEFVPTSHSESNVRGRDYAGPESCKSCHKENYEAWHGHAHRLMNALVDPETVFGDFSGEASISYLGGTGTFFKEGDEFHMRLERDGLQREYKINQTIGSRFTQYYIGQQISGPEPEGSRYYTKDHVLPFGYWLDYDMWIPVVHITAPELPDGKRRDPFAAVDELAKSESNFVYADKCNHCHTTFPLGDMLLRYPRSYAMSAPRDVLFSMSGYLSETHPEIWDGSIPAAKIEAADIEPLVNQMYHLEAPDHAVALGITCESCHLGAKEHAKGNRKKPSFFPLSPHFHIASDDSIETGRTHENVNWACGRCHTGARPKLAAGMATWNSTEYSDAMKGSCYSELTCIHCHEPHKGIGKKWSRPPAQDDAVCLKCHDQYKNDSALFAHTRHSAASEGSRCLNCHMPRINEGLQDAVRTHTIFSPTNEQMLEAGEPNACSLCHLDKTIDWTLEHLNQWYGSRYSEPAIAEAYPDRESPLGLHYLRHPREAVRLIASEALTNNDARWALSDLIEALDDEYLLNRQFAQKGLEEMLGIKLAEHGYVFYMQPGERQAPLVSLREAFLAEEDRQDAAAEATE